ncbi:MAG: chemotaxis-specific protein-glutamate methyltransferase CheB [Magnetococcales bacterium]|nr:chemotaxis-specific protein-glutamate methyltransferase CheB [Magnetococcales bacterium]
MLVDDSRVALGVLKKMLATSTEIEVVGTASDGKDALQQIPHLKPQVICTDLHMPKMDGLALTREIMRIAPLPILAISISVQSDNNHNVFQFLEAGAVDVFPKPRSGLDGNNRRLCRELTRKIKVLSGVVPIRRHSRKNRVLPTITTDNALPKRDIAHKIGSRNIRLITIGASTGGPQALAKIFSELPGNLPVPILCIQHISTGFLNEMVSWLDSHTPLNVEIAQHGRHPQPGTIYFPPEDRHLTLDDNGCFVSKHGNEAEHHIPAIDKTFFSVAKQFGASAIGVLLTGMGRDGADGLHAMRNSGAHTIAQDEETCVVFGMPNQAIQLGAAEKILPIQDVADSLLRLLNT